MSTGQFDGGNSSVDIPPSQVCIGLCEVNKNQPEVSKKPFVIYTPKSIKENP